MKTNRLSKGEKSALLDRMFQSALVMLREQPVMSIAALETALGTKHRSECERIAGKLQSGRTEWLNLVDWVKAYLTRKGLTRYFLYGGERYLLFLEGCGYVKDTGLVTRAHAEQVISSMVLLLTGGRTEVSDDAPEPLARRRR